MAYGNMQIQRMPAAQVPQYQQPVSAYGQQKPAQQMQRPMSMFGQQANRQPSSMLERLQQQLRDRQAQRQGGGGAQTQGQGANQPWAFDNANPWAASNYPGAQGGEQGLQRWLLQQAGQQGAFSGDYSQLLQPFRDAYQSDYGSGVRRSQLAGASGSMDPSQVAMLSRLGQSNAAGDSSRAMSQAILQLLQGRQNMNENLLSSFVNHGNQWASADQQGLLNRLQQGEAQRGQGGGLGSLLGNAAGMGIGRLTGGLLR